MKEQSGWSGRILEASKVDRGYNVRLQIYVLDGKEITDTGFEISGFAEHTRPPKEGEYIPLPNELMIELMREGGKVWVKK